MSLINSNQQSAKQMSLWFSPIRFEALSLDLGLLDQEPSDKINPVNNHKAWSLKVIFKNPRE